MALSDGFINTKEWRKESDFQGMLPNLSCNRLYDEIEFLRTTIKTYEKAWQGREEAIELHLNDKRKMRAQIAELSKLLNEFLEVVDSAVEHKSMSLAEHPELVPLARQARATLGQVIP